MDHDAYLAVLREESERLLAALDGVDPAAPVPTCEGWTASDLLWHVGHGQDHWARIALGADGDDDVPEPDRPADGDLPAFVAVAGTELLAALGGRPPGTPSWSWHPEGGTLAWLARRQAHEALVHRVDAELTAGLPVTPPVPTVAADGVDELLRHFVHGVPEWGTFTPDGVAVRLEATNVPDAWVLRLGRFTGTSPGSGTSYDLDAGMLADPTDDAVPADGGAQLVVRGSAWDLDLWLWGRGPGDHLETDGDPALLARLRELVRDATSD